MGRTAINTFDLSGYKVVFVFGEPNRVDCLGNKNSRWTE
jgi:hypothetical protein